MSTISSHGYVLVYVGKNHPLADVRGYAYEHRLIANERHPLQKGEIVHHEDENKQNNADENLITTGSLAEHKIRHRRMGSGLRLPGEDNPIISCLCGCERKFEKYDAEGRPRSYAHGHWRRGRAGGWKRAAQ